MSNLSEKKCKPCEGGVDPMSEKDIITMLDSLNKWEFKDGKITKTWIFKNHYQAISFVNAIAWISHQENHHPYITISFKDVKVDYWTHAIDGISENDFICAAKVDQLSVD